MVSYSLVVLKPYLCRTFKKPRIHSNWFVTGNVKKKKQPKQNTTTYTHTKKHPKTQTPNKQTKNAKQKPKKPNPPPPGLYQYTSTKLKKWTFLLLLLVFFFFKTGHHIHWVILEFSEVTEVERTLCLNYMSTHSCLEMDAIEVSDNTIKLFKVLIT